VTARNTGPGHCRRDRHVWTAAQTGTGAAALTCARCPVVERIPLVLLPHECPVPSTRRPIVAPPGSPRAYDALGLAFALVAALQLEEECRWALLLEACDEPLAVLQLALMFGNALAEDGPDALRLLALQGQLQAVVTGWPGEDLGAEHVVNPSCVGTVIVHHDGSAECFGAVDSDCPGEHVTHRFRKACFEQAEGCGRQCPVEGHPGRHT
jgi:hypothetical protein